MKRIISIIVIVLFTITLKLSAQNASVTKDTSKTKKEQCCKKTCADKSKCDMSKCPNSTNCKMQGNKGEGTNQTCQSMCKNMNKCMGANFKVRYNKMQRQFRQMPDEERLSNDEKVMKDIAERLKYRRSAYFYNKT